MDCSLPGSSVHGILQARILEWVAIPFSRGISWIQGSKLGLLHCRQILYYLSHKGSPIYVSVYVCVCCMCECCELSHVPLFVTHGPQGNSLWPTRLFCPWNFLSKNTGAGCHFLLQGSFPTQGLNLCLLHLQYWQVDSLPLMPYIYIYIYIYMGFPGGLVKNLPAILETWVWSLGWENSLERGTAIYSSILAWRIPWTEEPGRLQSMGLQRVVLAWAAFIYIFVTIRRLYFYIKWNTYLFSLPNSFRICVNLMFAESYSHYI